MEKNCEERKKSISNRTKDDVDGASSLHSISSAHVTNTQIKIITLNMSSSAEEKLRNNLYAAASWI